MVRRDIITIGASSGGVDAILKLLGDLPVTTGATIFIVLHIPASPPSLLPQLIGSRTRWEAAHPVHGDRIKKGHVHVAPPDHHMRIAKGRIHLDRGAKVNRSRPAVDPLFCSAALEFGPRVIGVILSGSLDDGTAGLRAIKSRGGTAVAQDPQDAVAPGMPSSALRHMAVDHTAPISKMSALLAELAATPVQPRGRPKDKSKIEKALTREGSMTPEKMEGEYGPASAFICPECNGPLWELRDGNYAQFRCLVGHQFSPESLLAEEAEALERSLWAAVKTLEERSALLRRLAAQSAESGQEVVARNFTAKAGECEGHACAIRKIVEKLQA